MILQIPFFGVDTNSRLPGLLQSAFESVGGLIQGAQTRESIAEAGERAVEAEIARRRTTLRTIDRLEELEQARHQRRIELLGQQPSLPDVVSEPVRLQPTQQTPRPTLTVGPGLQQAPPRRAGLPGRIFDMPDLLDLVEAGLGGITSAFFDGGDDPGMLERAGEAIGIGTTCDGPFFRDPQRSRGCSVEKTIERRNPRTGRIHVWEHRGHPVLFSRDVQAVRRVDKVTRRVQSALGKTCAPRKRRRRR